MAQQRYKGQAGMGGRGKNVARNRRDVATRRKVRVPRLRSRSPGIPSGSPARKNQKRNQRTWRAGRNFRGRKAQTRYSAERLLRF